MTLRKLPEIKAFERPDGIQFEPDPSIMARWQSGVRAATEGGDNVISIYGVIGEDFWTGEGVTSKRIGAALRAIGDREVVVNINSPGGDLFEGVAIYEQLRLHSKRVTVRVVSLAASAASVIAMAGDTIEISRAGFFMIHNCWVLAIGNRHDLRESADWLEPFDAAMADVYAARTGLDTKEIAKLLDSETWIGGAEAVDKGFADDLLAAGHVVEDAKALASAASVAAVRRVEAILANSGMPRSERRRLIADLKSGKPGAAAPAMHDAGDLAAVAASLRSLDATIKT